MCTYIYMYRERDTYVNTYINDNTYQHENEEDDVWVMLPQTLYYLCPCNTN